MPEITHHHHTTPQPFYGPFSRTTQVSRCQKRTSAAPPSPIFLQAGCPSCHATNSFKALKAMVMPEITQMYKNSDWPLVALEIFHKVA